MGRPHKHICVFEREPQLQLMLQAGLKMDDVSIRGFSKHQECLVQVSTRACDLLVLDLDGYESEGLNVLRQVKQIVPWIMALAVVGHAAVGSAIKAIKAGASDCLDKPVTEERLLAAVRGQLARFDGPPHRRIRALTAVQVQVLQMILAGKHSCDIAAELHRSKRTIDVHRQRIMSKLQAACLADLIRRAFEVGFHRQSEETPEVQRREESDQDLSKPET